MAEDQVADVLVSEFSTLALAREHFPMWTTWGVQDESVAVHSLGLTYLTTVGQAHGYACCCEFPVAGHRVRADSVWWRKQSRDAVALFEFERHKGGDELRDKVRNLLRAYHGLGRQPQMLGLIFWTKNFYPLTDERLGQLWRLFELGYDSEDRTRVPGAATSLLRVFECLHQDAGPGRHTLKAIRERRRP